MALLSKRTAGGVGEYMWESDDDTLEVPDHVAAILLSIQDADFYQKAEEPAKTSRGKKASAAAEEIETPRPTKPTKENPPLELESQGSGIVDALTAAKVTKRPSELG
jgi:hypothetical protein